jgi:RES domain-containing protein
MRFVGTVYRAHNPRWAHDPLSDAGAARHGGRFNRPGVAALYTSLSFKTAWLEAQQGFVRKTQPMTLCAYEVDCDGIVDFFGFARERYPPAALACAWEAIMRQGGTPPSWNVADELRAAGDVGIVVQSYASGAQPDDKNLVLWRWEADLPYRVTLIDDHARLPADGKPA